MHVLAKTDLEDYLNEMNGVLDHICAQIGKTEHGESPED